MCNNLQELLVECTTPTLLSLSIIIFSYKNFNIIKDFQIK